MLLTALVLTVWACFCIYDVLGPTLIYASRPLIAGTVAGLIVGDLTLGMAIGGTMELTALGLYTYGGATIPDFTTGAIVGTALAHATGGGLGFGLTVGLPAAVLLSALDPIGRFLPTFWIHRADVAAVSGRTRELTVLHWTAFIPWAAVRAVPTFLAVYYGGAVATVEKNIPHWFVNGMTLVGAILPAVGFGMLLTLLPVKRYWYLMLIGYVLFAYMKVPLVGIALFGLAIAAMFVTLKPPTPLSTVLGRGSPLAGGSTSAATPAATPEGSEGETTNV